MTLTCVDTFCYFRLLWLSGYSFVLTDFFVGGSVFLLALEALSEEASRSGVVKWAGIELVENVAKIFRILEKRNRKSREQK